MTERILGRSGMAGMVAIFLIVFGVGMAGVLAASVTPVLIDPWTSGDAAFELGQIGCTADYGYKVEPWGPGDPSGLYYHAGNTIAITAYLDDGEYRTFDWTSVYPVLCVIVKAETKAYVFWYPGGSYGDTGLYAPDGAGVSHATFGFDGPENGNGSIPLIPVVAIPAAVSVMAIMVKRRR